MLEHNIVSLSVVCCLCYRQHHFHFACWNVLPGDVTTCVDRGSFDIFQIPFLLDAKPFEPIDLKSHG